MRGTLKSTILFACLSLALASCGKSEPTKAPPASPTQLSGSAKPKDLIVGKWQRSDPGKEKEVLEIVADGKIVTGEPGFAFEGKYKFIDDDSFEFAVKPLAFGRQLSGKYKVKAAKDDLTLELVEAKSRDADDGKWQTNGDDQLRLKSPTEKYKRMP